jgi:hypothetical protein
MGAAATIDFHVILPLSVRLSVCERRTLTVGFNLFGDSTAAPKEAYRLLNGPC